MRYSNKMCIIVIYQLYVDLCPESIRNVPDISSSHIHSLFCIWYLLPKKCISRICWRFKQVFLSKNSKGN